MLRNYGWKPSFPDPRNIPTDASELKVSFEVDPRPDMSTPYDQSSLGSCTANALAGAVEYDNHLDDVEFMPSRLFIYLEERRREGTLNYDSGAYGSDGFYVLRHLGAPPETEWPYDIFNYTEIPVDQVYADALQHKIGWYKHPNQSESIFKRILSNHQTIAFGFSVFESFESDQVAKEGVVPMPDPSEEFLGGHEVLIVGYLADMPEHALVRNSWGPRWGLDGYFLMPWSYILDPNLSTDFRTLYRPKHG